MVFSGKFKTFSEIHFVMKTLSFLAILSISIVMVVGMPLSFAESSEHGDEKSCPSKGKKLSGDYAEGLTYYETRDKTIQNTSQEQIPDWLRSNAKWWSTGVISDSEFGNGIKYMMENDLIKTKSSHLTQTSIPQTPAWMKSNAGWWADGKISDAEFVSGLQHLVNSGLI